MKLTLLANGHSELFEDDALDLCDFYEATGRTVPRRDWADECRVAAQVAADRRQNEGIY